MKKDNKNDPALRHAMYHCHNGTDPYTDEPLMFETMQIDHIIPTHYQKSPEKLAAVLEELERSPDFELDSIENYLPTSGRINRKKSGHDFSVKGARFYLELAERIAPKVRASIEEFKVKKKIDKSLEDVKTSVYHGNHDPESVYNYLSEDKEDFPETREVFLDNSYYLYLHSKKNVRMDASLPYFSDNDWEGSCILTFRSLKLRDVTLTLNHQQLAKELFGALFTPPDLLKRNFIVAKHPKQDVFFIKIGNSRFPLQRDEVDQLCEIVDDFAKEYIKAFQEVESLMEAEGFRRSEQYEKGYRLLEINRKLWEQMIQFANDHDYAKGNTPWYMFDGNDFMIKVCTDESSDRYDEGYHVFLESEPVRRDYRGSADSIWVVWDAAIEPFGSVSFHERQSWGVLTTYKWLVNELLPQVTNSKSVKVILSDGYRARPTLEDVSSSVELHNLLIRMQRFYYVPRKFMLERWEMQSLYKALLSCLRKIELNDLNYISKKARVGRTVNTMDELRQEIERKSLEFDEQELRSYSMVDNLFRTLEVSIREKPKLNAAEISEIVSFLRPFYEKMLHLATIERMMGVNE